MGHRGAFAAGDDEGVDVFQIAGEAHLNGVRAKAAQREFVLEEVALQRQDAYADVGSRPFWGLQVSVPGNRGKGRCTSVYRQRAFLR